MFPLQPRYSFLIGVKLLAAAAFVYVSETMTALAMSVYPYETGGVAAKRAKKLTIRIDSA